MKEFKKLFNNENKKVATAKQLEEARHKGYGEGVFAMALVALGLEFTGKVVGWGVTKAVKIATRNKEEENVSDDEENEADFFEDDSSTDESDKEEDSDIKNQQDDPVKKTATVQEETSSEPIKEEESDNDSNDPVDTDGCDEDDEPETEEKSEEKEEVKVEEIDDDLRDIMNSIEQMPREKRKEISRQIDDGTFVVPDGITISADTLKRLSTFMMNSAISEEEVLKKSEDESSTETNTEEKTA